MARLLVPVVVAALGLAGAPAAGQLDADPAVPSGRILYLMGGNRLTSIDVASGAKTVRRAPVAACGPELYVTGGRVIFAELGRLRTKVFSVPVTLDEAPTPLGAAHFFVPSATGGRVWLAGSFCKRRARLGAREVAVDGEVVSRSDRRMPPGWLAGAVEDGLLVQRRWRLTVWDPRTGRTSVPRGIDSALSVGGNRVYGCVTGTRCRKTAIVDLDSGRLVAPRVPAGYLLDGVIRFSPDGALAAAPVIRKRRFVGVALVDTRDGATQILASPTVWGYPELAWSPTSGWLFFRGPDESVMAYRPGEERAVKLPFRVPRRALRLLAG